MMAWLLCVLVPSHFFMLITVASFKGGVGKTTTAIHLAAALAASGNTILVDGDANASASAWNSRGRGLPFTVASIDGASGASIEGFTHVVVDTGARPARDDLEALAGGDLLILPTTTEAMAIHALLQTASTLAAIGGRYRVLLTMVSTNRRATSAAMVREALEIPVFRTQIRRYAAYEKASLAGCLVHQTGDRYGGIAWSEYRALAKEVEAVVNGKG
jgi:chromosome partitioning protein